MVKETVLALESGQIKWSGISQLFSHIPGSTRSSTIDSTDDSKEGSSNPKKRNAKGGAGGSRKKQKVDTTSAKRVGAQKNDVQPFPPCQDTILVHQHTLTLFLPDPPSGFSIPNKRDGKAIFTADSQPRPAFSLKLRPVIPSGGTPAREPSSSLNYAVLVPTDMPRDAKTLSPEDIGYNNSPSNCSFFSFLFAATTISSNNPEALQLVSIPSLEEDYSTLVVDVSIFITPKFYNLYSSIHKHHVLDFLFPPSSSSSLVLDDSSFASPQPTTEFFYMSLRPAPFTQNGRVISQEVAIPGRTIEGQQGDNNQDTADDDDDDGDEKTEQVGRGKRKVTKGKAITSYSKKKGKQRAITPPPGARDPSSSSVGGNYDSVPKPKGLKPSLFPFQGRSLRWLLGREGKRLNTEEELEEIPEDEEFMKNMKRVFWDRCCLGTNDSDSEKVLSDVWINRITGQISLEDPVEFDEDDMDLDLNSIEGEKPGYGLLSDEMGLGKSVILIGLIMTNPQPHRNDFPPYWVEELDCEVQPSSLSLIICPDAIVMQWLEEISRHAPDLRVLRYESVKKLPDRYNPKYVSQNFDLVLTTFDVLKKEVVIARKPHRRQLRNRDNDGRGAGYRRSLLVQLNYLRVVLDEAQMLLSPLSQVSETASLIQRRFSYGCSGTPIKSSIDDLHSLLKFLRVPPFGTGELSFEKRCWERLCSRPARAIHRRLWREIGIRTLKVNVEHELYLPPQNRWLVPVDFVSIERFSYNELYQEALAELGFAPDGSLLVGEGWRPDRQVMSKYLTALRQMCCHPQVGDRNRRALGGNLQTMEEVLETMRAQNLTALFGEQRALAANNLKRYHLGVFDEDCEGLEKGVAGFDSVVEFVDPVVESVELEIKTLLREKRAAQNKADALETEDVSDISFVDDSLDEPDEDPDDLGDREKALISRIQIFKRMRRELLETKHSAFFFKGNALATMGTFPEEEAEAYEKAEQLRCQLLSSEKTAAENGIQEIQKLLTESEEDKQNYEFSSDRKLDAGLQTTSIFEDIDDCTDRLNDINDLLLEWRSKILEGLATPIAGQAEAQGDEYTGGVEVQDRLDVYIVAHQACLADWREVLTGDRILQEERRRPGLKDRRGKKIVPSLEAGFAPSEVLAYELDAKRIEHKQPETFMYSMRALIRRLQEVAQTSRQDEEIAIANTERKRIHSELSRLQKAFDLRRAENEVLTTVFNKRAAYFRGLQVFSDSVADPRFKEKKGQDLQRQLDRLDSDKPQIEERLRVRNSKTKYLDFLRSQCSEVGAGERICSICCDEFNKGALTDCNHLFCSTCLLNWLRQHHNCPLCKNQLDKGGWRLVTLGQQKRIQRQKIEDVPAHETLDSVPGVHILGDSSVQEIGEISSSDSLSSKINMISKHIIKLRDDDPSSKTVIYSAWLQALDILSKSLEQNGIRFVRLDKTGGKKQKEGAVKSFQNNPNVAVFLLHTRSQAAGLNLNAATTLIFVEPLLHPGLELQAQGRIHRIGQKQKTTVFQYYVRDTCDERVALLGARRHAAMATMNKRTVAVDAPSPGKKRTKNAAEAEDYDEDDLATVLFAPAEFQMVQKVLVPNDGQIQEESNSAANLLEIDDDDEMEPMLVEEVTREQRRELAGGAAMRRARGAVGAGSSSTVNAEAGPSRLRR